MDPQQLFIFSVKVENFKSVHAASLTLSRHGRLIAIVGANGAGTCQSAPMRVPGSNLLLELNVFVYVIGNLKHGAHVLCREDSLLGGNCVCMWGSCSPPSCESPRRPRTRLQRTFGSHPMAIIVGKRNDPGDNFQENQREVIIIAQYAYMNDI